MSELNLKKLFDAPADAPQPTPPALPSASDPLTGYYKRRGEGSVTTYLPRNERLMLKVFCDATGVSLVAFAAQALRVLRDVVDTQKVQAPSPETVSLVQAFINRHPDLFSLPPRRGGPAR